jgi:hypothetical protein
VPIAAPAPAPAPPKFDDTEKLPPVNEATVGQSAEAIREARKTKDFESARHALEGDSDNREQPPPPPANEELEDGERPSLAEIAKKNIEARLAEAAPPPPAPVPRESEKNLARASAKVPVAPPPIAVPAGAPPQANEKVEAEARPLAAYELLARSARLADLASLTNRIVTEAARARVSDWFFTSKVGTIADELRLTREDCDTRFGNVLDVLGSGGEGPSEKALAAALWAHAVAETPRARTEEEDSLAADILWLATHTAFDATLLLDRALGEEASDLWIAIADRVKRIERGRGGALGRGEAIVGCAALAASGAARAKTLCSELAREVKDPVLLRVLSTGEDMAPEEVRLEGEMLPTPRGPVATTLLAFSGLLFAIHAVRLLARLALAYRRPAEVSLSESGIRVKTRTEMLGRTLREREHVILRSGLVRVVREVRFPRAAFYAGLFALAIGSYIGVRAFVDGVRSASPSLLVVGLVIVAIGIGADFVLGTILPGSRGRCRLAFVPRSGPTICVGDVDMRRADDALARSLRK